MGPLTPEEEARLALADASPAEMLGAFTQIVHARYSDAVRQFKAGKAEGWYGAEVYIDELNRLKATNSLLAELLGQAR